MNVTTSMEERKMNNEQALQEFIAKAQEARALVAMIQAELDDHMGVHPDRVTWANVGDANHVHESLREIVRFMGHSE